MNKITLGLLGLLILLIFMFGCSAPQEEDLKVEVDDVEGLGDDLEGMGGLEDELDISDLEGLEDDLDLDF